MRAAIGFNVATVLTCAGPFCIFSAAEMSSRGPFVERRGSIDHPNQPRSNTFISYYTYGAALGLGLDLILRYRIEGTSLAR